MNQWDSNGGSMDANKMWFALKVRERFERNVSDGLKAKDIETFVPVYSVRRNWSDRVKTLELPLFAGYVFCRIEPDNRMAALTIPGVHYFVGIGRAPEPVADSEIESLRALVRSGAATAPLPYLEQGDRVRVEHGPLRGVEGILLKGGHADQLVVSIELLQRSVAVAIDRDSVVPLERRARPSFGLPRLACVA